MNTEKRHALQLRVTRAQSFWIVRTAFLGLILLAFSRNMPAQESRIDWAYVLPDEDSEGYCVAADPKGDTILSGCVFPNLVLAKLDREGGIKWMQKLAASQGFSCGYDMATDFSGNIYVAGSFAGRVDFDPGSANHLQAACHNLDGFLCKYDMYGEFLWVRTWAGPLLDPRQHHSPMLPLALALDCSANVYITSTTSCQSSVLDISRPSNGNPRSQCRIESFLRKYSPSGESLWECSLGSAEPRGLAVNDGGELFVTGIYYDEVSIDPGKPWSSSLSSGSADVLLAKFDSSGQLEWVIYWGTDSYDESNAACVDGQGNIYVGGRFRLEFHNGTDVEQDGSDTQCSYLCRISGVGALEWTPEWLDSDYVNCRSIDVDDSGMIYITGKVDDFSFARCFGADGREIWTHTWHSTGLALTQDICVDDSGRSYVIGTSMGNVDSDSGHLFSGYSAARYSHLYVIAFASGIESVVPEALLPGS